MTGYLHIEDGQSLDDALVAELHDRGFSPGDAVVLADSLVSVLRGLSVEPTEGEAAQRVRHWCEFHRANYNGAPAERLSSSYRDAPLLLADLESLVAAPVPVQEDRP